MIASIVIATWNRPELLREAAASALAALPAGGELVVADDRSNPPAAEALAGLAGPALRIVVNDGRRGAAANRNRGVAAARGDVVFFLDDDDLLLPGYPAAVLSQLARSSPRPVWGFSATAVHPRGAPPVAPAGGYGPGRVLQGGPIRRRLAGLGCGFWIRRETFLALGGLDEGLTVNEDTEFCLRLLAAGHDPLYVPSPGVSLLKAEGGITVATPPDERARCFRTILDRHADYLARTPEAHRHLLRRLLKMQARANRLGAALRTAAGEGRPAGRPANAAYALANWAMYRLKP